MAVPFVDWWNLYRNKIINSHLWGYPCQNQFFIFFYLFFLEREICLNGMIESIQGKIVQIKDGCLTVIEVTTIGLMLKVIS